MVYEVVVEMAKRWNICIRIIRYLGFNSSVIAGLLCLPLRAGEVSNFGDLYNAALVTNGLPEKTVGPSCRNPYGRKPFVRRNPYIDEVALFNSERRALSVDMTNDEKDLFDSVGGMQVGGRVVTATLTQCKCVVTTAAHSFFDQMGKEIPNWRKDAVIRMAGGKPNGYRIKDVIKGDYSFAGDRDAINDWAVIILSDNVDTGAKPLTVPVRDIPYGELNNSRLVSVAINRGVEGSDRRRLSECPRAGYDDRWKNLATPDQISFNYCSNTKESSGSAVVPMDGPYKFNFVELNIGAVVHGAAPEQVLPQDNLHYNVALPVRGRFRDAIFDACSRCPQVKTADSSK